MKSEKNILTAFILNLSFSVLELAGGILTNSVAIMSDSIHDFGDAASIAVSYFLEKKSKKQPDKTYTYGYLRYSVIGSVITTLMLMAGSVFMVVNAVDRFLNPVEIHYNGMIILAVIGVAVNCAAVYFTRNGKSLNQKAVNLHMLEDVLGWVVVLIGAVAMRFTDFKFIDPILSICVSVYIFVHAVLNLKDTLNLFLIKVPHGIDVDEIADHLKELEGVTDVHHIHVWSIDGNGNYATMHIVYDGEASEVKKAVKEELREFGIVHATLEMENEEEHCEERHCSIHVGSCRQYAHHHHH